MDKLNRYRTIIKQILTEYHALINQSPIPIGVETELVIDEERNQYMLVNVVWAKQKRFRGTTVYLRIREDKIWVEEDWLEDGIVKDLVAVGIPKKDIVLAVHHPDMRPLTEFATGGVNPNSQLATETTT